MSRYEGVLGKVKGKSEERIPVEDVHEFFFSHITLMLVGLDSDGGDGNSGIQKSVDQYALAFGKIEIVNKKGRIGICRLGCIEYFLDELYPSEILADPGDRIVVSVIHLHDDNFVDDIPVINDALESGDIAVDAVELLLKNGRIVILHQPVRTYGIPTEGMTLESFAL